MPLGHRAERIGVGRIRAILNKMPSEKITNKIIKDLIGEEIRFLSRVYIDPQVSESGLEGTPLGDSKAKKQLKTLIRLMLDAAEMKYKKDGE
jgi:CO dehydrogenase nickel-insertion accessory protein CooC1